MRAIRRTTIILSCIGFVALYGLQYVAALAVTPLIVVVGLLTGLAVAKWLPWAWYGRQFAAGARVGVITCGLSAAGVLLSLIGSGSHNLPVLAARSHLSGIDLSSLVASLGAPGWFTPYVLLTVFFTIGGVLLAGVVAQIFSWSKNVRTVRAIKQAHDAAASLHRIPTWGPASNNVPSIGGYWNAVLPSSGPASHPGHLPGAAFASINQPSGSRASISGGQASRVRSAHDVPFEQPSTYLAPLPPLEFDEQVEFDEQDTAALLPPMPEPIPLRRTTSGVQAVQTAMTDDLQSMLDQWENDSAKAEQEQETSEQTKSASPKKSSTTKKTPSKRQPKASAYLNSGPPAPRRSRKKQDTRDWLC